MRPMCATAVIAMLLATVLAVPGIASEDDAPDHLVHAGAVADDPLKPYVYEDYFPRDLKVHGGDRVRWEFPVGEWNDTAFHTVTFAPTPDAAPMVRRDELPGTFAWHERSFFDTGCGLAGQAACVLSDPEQFVSSGTPIAHGLAPFDAVVDLPPGTYSYFCTIHAPVMQGSIEVVADDVALDNPAPEDFADHIAQLTAEADALMAELSAPTPVDEDGRRTWAVHAGARTREEGGVGLLGFVPASLSVRPGDRVRWVAGDEVHGVTFPDPGQVDPLMALPAAYFTFGCDFDEPDAGAPGVPLLGWVELLSRGQPVTVPCPVGSTLEMPMNPHGASPQRAPGNAVVSPATYHNSGLLAPENAPDRLAGKPPASGERFPSGFDASFPVPGTFPYRCLIHPDMMGGSVTVELGRA